MMSAYTRWYVGAKKQNTSGWLHERRFDDVASAIRLSRTMREAGYTIVLRPPLDASHVDIHELFRFQGVVAY
jgi:hypothetical protein